jgi:putative ABC transport system permease protein
MLRATLKSLFARKVRLFLSTLAVVLGVSFVTGTLVLTDTLNRTFDDLFAGIFKNVDVGVRAVNAADSADNVDRAPVQASLLPTVAGVAGVAAAVPNVNGQAVVVDPGTGDAYDTGGAPGIGTSWTGGTATGSEELVEGGAPHGDEIAVDKATADDLGLRVGSRIPVITNKPCVIDEPGEPRRPCEFTVAGTFQIAGQDGVGGASVVSFDTPTAQRLLLAEPGAFSSISVAADKGLSQERLRERITAALQREPIPGAFSSISVAADKGLSQEQLRERITVALQRARIAGVEAVTGEQLADEQASVIQDAVSGLSTFLLIFAGIAVFVGAFIIFNTFTMLVAQRVRELALLRAVGASRRQVQTSVQIEAAVIGVVGAGSGLVLGAFLAIGLRGLVSAVGIKLPAGDLVFQPRTIVVALLVGLVVTGVAAWIPARKAATVPPVAAMRETFVLPVRSLRTRGVAGVVLTLLGGVLMVAGLAGTGSGAAFAVGGGAIGVFLGVATLSPLLSPTVTGVLGKPLPRLFGTTGKLGRQNAMRNPRRTAATASALMIGLAVVSAFSVVGQSIKVSVRDAVSDSLGADFILTPSSFGQGFSGGVARDLVDEPGIEAATGIRFDNLEVNGKKDTVSAAEPAAVETVLALDGVAGNLADFKKEEKKDSIIVDADTAAERGYAIDEKIPVVFPDGPKNLTLVATYEPNELAGHYMVSLDEWGGHKTPDLDQVVLVKVAENGDSDAVRAAVDKAAEPFPNIEVRDQREFIAEQEKQVDTILGLIYVLLALTIVIALFGIVNTLALSVIERTREIGLLRAVGMTRGQLRTAIRLEAMVISVFGAILGVAVGSFFGWALASALESEGITTFAYPAGTIVVVVIAGAVLGVVAAIFPARRAAKMDVLRAIAAT